MKASTLYRTASILLVVFAIAHTLGFTQSDPEWQAEAVLGLMRSVHFDVQGFERTYWDLFRAAGYSVGAFYFFAAALAWQLGTASAQTRAQLRVTGWAFTACFVAITVVSCAYLFILPILFSALISACLLGGALLAQRQPG